MKKERKKERGKVKNFFCLGFPTSTSIQSLQNAFYVTQFYFLRRGIDRWHAHVHDKTYFEGFRSKWFFKIAEKYLL